MRTKKEYQTILLGIKRNQERKEGEQKAYLDMHFIPSSPYLSVHITITFDSVLATYNVVEV
jgi:hypothetical protein